MPLHTDLIGQRGEAVTDRLEDRWTMNYAASVNDLNPVYYANEGGARVPVHPTYVSFLEWDAIGMVEAQLSGITDDDRLRGVHSYNHTTLDNHFGAGDELRSVATVVGVERRRSGGRLTFKIETTVEDRMVATSYTSVIYRGVAVEGGEDVTPEIPSLGAVDLTGTPDRIEALEIGALAPYHFSECARDYGAIHTDRNEAQKAGLPGIILHGTGTIAYALSSITNHEAGGDPTRVVGFEARLADMVPCPSTTSLRVFDRRGDGDAIRFELMSQAGGKAISGGVVRLSPEAVQHPM
ncbi:MAG: MaoC/PaaZ C-terminal domain-containing protein [Nocardioidaceae bacterium]